MRDLLRDLLRQMVWGWHSHSSTWTGRGLQRPMRDLLRDLLRHLMRDHRLWQQNRELSQRYCIRTHGVGRLTGT